MGNQRFNIQFDFQANVGPMKAAISELQKSLTGVKLPDNMANNFTKIFNNLESEFANFQALTKDGLTSMADVNKVQSSFARISKLMNQLGLETSKVKGLDVNKLIPKEAQARTENLQKKLKELQNQQDKKSGYAEELKKQNSLLEKQRIALEGLKARRDALANENKTLGAAKGAEATKKSAAEADKAQVVTRMKELEGTKGGKSSGEYKDLSQELTRLNTVIRGCDQEMGRLTTQINKNKSVLGSLDGEIGEAKTAFDGLKTKINELKSIDIDPKMLLELRQELATLLNVDISKIPTDLTQIKTTIEGINSPAIKKVAEDLGIVETNTIRIKGAFDQAKQGVRGFTDTAQTLDRAAQDMENLKNQVYHFFSLTNSVQLFKRAIKSALNTVKELDATMTEAAVVTKFSVSDMWDKLPLYADQAQKLGVSINDMYQATTLYYQQGLKTNEAMALGVETMKMAKIAGMESAEATEAMTAALRGFNMELNETSAIRVNDVYSQLAAVTAADTEQIATAMSKTASIAHSANMEFETTAALLAQIIETTQEAPETAGTAMKTIIARFSEVKELKEQGSFTGKDSEGEDIDVNKIQSALKSVGISMEGFFAGTEGLDSILLKLAEKWGTLDFETQRYIATMAAGSRQQSRFIAMMSDYSRTTELVGEAQNSTGASQKQFEKTLDSMASKLQRLENAWNEFLMGLSNNVIIKGVVSFLTTIVEGLNKVTDALSGGNGLVKSLFSLITVLTALKVARSALGKGLGWAGKQAGLNPQGQQNGQGTSGQQVNPMKQAMPNPQADGQQAGQQAGQGFMSGLKSAIQAGKGGLGIKQTLGAMFTGGAVDRREKVHRLGKSAKYGTKGDRQRQQQNQQYIKEQKMSFMRQAHNQNKDNGIPHVKDLAPVNKAFDDIIAKGGTLQEAAGAANQELKNMGGTAVELGPEFEDAGAQLQNTSLNMGAIAGTAMAAGGAMMGLSAALSALGASEEVTEGFQTFGTILMGVGSVISLVTTLAPLLGMSFTTAGVQISIAGWTAQISWWWVFAIIVGVIALVAAFSALTSAMEESSDAAQLEALNKQVEELGEAADEAKQKLDDMASAKDGLVELSKAFDGLTKGTKEWKQALVENNQKVLELLNTYPQLANYVDKGMNGELIITEEGWDNAMAEQQKAYTTSLNAQTAVAQQRDEKKLRVKTEETMAKVVGERKAMTGERGLWASLTGDTSIEKQKARYAEQEQERMDKAQFSQTAGGMWGRIVTGALAGGLVGGIIGAFSDTDPEDIEREQTGGLTYKELNAFGALAADRGLSMAADSSKEEFKQAYIDLGYNPKDFEAVWANMKTMGTAFDELANSALAVEEAEKARAAAIAENLSQNSSVVSESDYSKQIVDATSATFKDYDDKIKKRAKKYTEDLDDSNYDSKEATEAIARYAELQGMTNEQVKKQLENEELSAQTIANTLAAQDIDQEMTKAMEAIAGLLESLTTVQADRVSHLMSDNGGDLTSADLEVYGDMEKGRFENHLRSLGIDGAKAKEMGYDSFDDLRDAWYENVQAAERVRDDIFSGTYEQTKGIFSQIEKAAGTTFSTDQLEQVTDTFKKMGINGEEAGEVLNSFKDGLSSVDPKNVESVMNTLSLTNWNSLSDASAAMEELRNKGWSGTQIENFWETLMSKVDLFVGSMTEALSLVEKFAGRINEVSGIEERLSEGKGTQEDMQALIDAGVDISEFQRTPEGWKATGEQIEEATKRLKEYNAEEANRDLTEHKESFANNLERIKGLGVEYDAETNSYTRQAGAKSFLAGITEFDNGVMKAGTIADATEAEVIAAEIGEDPARQVINGVEETDEAYTARIQGLYEQWISNMMNAQWITTMLEKAAAMTNAASYTTNEAVGQGLSDETVRQAMQQEAFDLGLDVEEVTAYSDSLKEAGIESQALRDQMAITHAKINQGAKEVNDNWEKWKQNLSEEDTLDYNNALTEMGNSAKKLLGIEQNLSKAFLENKHNQELLIKAAQGNKTAMQELGKAASKDVFKNLGKSGEEALKRVQDDIDAIADADIEIGVTVTMNDDDPNASLAEKLTNVYNEAYYAALWGGQLVQDAVRAANDAIAAQGFVAPEMEMVAETTTVTGELPDGWTPLEDGSRQVVGPNGEILKGVEWIENDGGTYTYEITRLVPKGGQGFTRISNSIGGGSKGSGGGGGGGGSKEKYENSHDKMYNTYEKINALLREREKIERRYDKLLKKRALAGKDLVKNAKEELANLASQETLQKQVEKGKLQEIRDLMAKNSKYNKYVTGFDTKTGAISINWNAFNKIKDSDYGEKVDEYLSKLEGLRDQWQEAQDALDEIEDSVEEIRERGKDEYFSLEDQIKEALINDRQKEIDKLSEINESINDTNSRILDSMQQQIDEYRKTRDNEKTEKEISDKQRELAFLQQDTSGANATQILQLQKEIEESQESYTDQLIDQKISELQKQNDQAAEQRERQISLMESQLKYYEESGALWNDAYRLFEQGTTKDGALDPGSALAQLLMNSEGYTAMSNLGKQEWWATTAQTFAHAFEYLTLGLRAQEGEKITFTTSDNKTATGTADKNGNVTTSGGTYSDVHQNMKGEWITSEKAKGVDAIVNTGTTNSSNWPYAWPKPSTNSTLLKKGSKGDRVRGLQQALNNLGYRAGTVDGIFGSNTDKAVKDFQKDAKGWQPKIGRPDGKVGPQTREAFRLKQYETGGLADFTGPAWLDGTKSKPEYILDAKQTKAFFTLVDVLSSLKSKDSQTTQNSGDSTYDIDINVESIGSDYDVEQLAETVKRLINEDARYRNNNAISLMR